MHARKAQSYVIPRSRIPLILRRHLRQTSVADFTLIMTAANQEYLGIEGYALMGAVFEVHFNQRAFLSTSRELRLLTGCGIGHTVLRK